MAMQGPLITTTLEGLNSKLSQLHRIPRTECLQELGDFSNLLHFYILCTVLPRRATNLVEVFPFSLIII